MFSLTPVLVEIEATEMHGALDRARAGDSDAFGQICRASETRLLRQALTLCGNTALAEDLAQDTLVEAWKCLHRYNGRCQFFTWLCAILLNRYRNAVRKKHALPLSSLCCHDQQEYQNRIDQLTDHDASPDQVAQGREQAALVLECIQLLPAKHQQVIYLRFYVDDSLEGIAAALGCSLGTVKSRLFRALDNLRGMNLFNTRSTDLALKV